MLISTPETPDVRKEENLFINKLGFRKYKDQNQEGKIRELETDLEKLTMRNGEGGGEGGAGRE